MINDTSRLDPKVAGEFRIAHLSDLHLSADTSEWRSRVRSWLGASHGRTLINLQAIIRDLTPAEVDHLIITGDLTSGARDEEFELLKTTLGDWLDSGRTTLLPGNHDVGYRHGILRRPPNGMPRKLATLAHHFSDFFPTTHPPAIGRGKRQMFPLTKTLAGDRIALIGLDTTSFLSIKASPFNGLGAIRAGQFRELRALLKSPWIHDRLKIVAMHHHPLIVPVSTLFDNWTALFQSRHLLDLLYASEVDLILHGHKHQPFCWQSRSYQDHNMTVICSGPPDAHCRPNQPDLVYNIYSVIDHHVTIHFRHCRPTLRPRPQIRHAARPLPAPHPANASLETIAALLPRDVPLGDLPIRHPKISFTPPRESARLYHRRPGGAMSPEEN